MELGEQKPMEGVVVVEGQEVQGQHRPAHSATGAAPSSHADHEKIFPVDLPLRDVLPSTTAGRGRESEYDGDEMPWKQEQGAAFRELETWWTSFFREKSRYAASQTLEKCAADSGDANLTMVLRARFAEWFRVSTWFVNDVLSGSIEVVGKYYPDEDADAAATSTSAEEEKIY
ncbi:unnamed protein product, partial [Amoebophrya sp. A25]|eukprot:GSA25T00004111001.1